MRLLIIVAGTNDPSNCNTLALCFSDGARSIAGIETDIVHLCHLTIDHFSLRCYDKTFRDEDDFRMLRSKIEAADGLVFASPIWNFGIPGHFKNLLDRCGAFGLDAETRTKGQWKGKPFYLIFTGGSPSAGWIGLQRKTTSFVPVSIKYFGAAHVGTHYEPRCMQGKGQFGLVVDRRPETLDTVRRKGEAFGKIVKTYAETGSLPVQQTVMRLVYRAGQFFQRRLT